MVQTATTAQTETILKTNKTKTAKMKKILKIAQDSH